MNKVNVWNTTGSILKQFDTVEEAEEWVDDCGHDELYRDQKGGDTNIMVMESY